MSRRFRLVAELLTALLLVTGFAHAVFAQTAFVTNRVVAIDEDAAGQSVTLQTTEQAPLPAPQIQYLPGFLILTAKTGK